MNSTETAALVQRLRELAMHGVRHRPPEAWTQDVVRALRLAADALTPRTQEPPILDRWNYSGQPSVASYDHAVDVANANYRRAESLTADRQRLTEARDEALEKLEARDRAPSDTYMQACLIADRAELQAQLATLTAERDALQQERDEAVAHDRQPYPTADAYERVCGALNEHKAEMRTLRNAAVVATERMEAAEAQLAALTAAPHDCEAWAAEGIGCMHCNPISAEVQELAERIQQERATKLEAAEAQLAALRSNRELP